MQNNNIIRIISALSIVLGLSISGFNARAQVDDQLIHPVDTLSSTTPKRKVYSDVYLDSIEIKKKFVINDYSLIGVNVGSQINSMLFNPSKGGNMLFQPVYFGVTFTQYGKMFGFMPYVGFQTGLYYSHEGYEFKMNKTTGSMPDYDGATKAVMDVVEVPMLAEFHVDAAHFRFLLDLGIYGGYRMNIERTQHISDQYDHSFKEYEHRLTYGLKGGVGFALAFDPIEFHIKGAVRYGWSNLTDPDYYSQYYYRYTYPFDICITAGVHFQLTKRTGKTKKDLKKEAYDMVFGNNQ